MLSEKRRGKVYDLTQFTQQKRRQAARRAAARPRPVAGNLALQPQAAPAPVPVARPTPARWFSEAHRLIGFRLWDIVYLFAVARQCLTTEEALGWACRYWQGGFSAEHDRAVIDLLTPGALDGEVALDAGARRRALDAAFAAAVKQGASRLLGRKDWDWDDLPAEDARRLAQALVRLYGQQGWHLPPLPFGLQHLLYRLGCQPTEL